MSGDIRVDSLKEPIDIAEYLFRRLHQIGVKSIHGVPGDYNLRALDYITQCNLNWVGSVNELNAGYAADGYARVNGSMSALVTTFGVGELSAMNAQAGAFAEYVPIVHIVGTPSTLSQANGMLLHHTLGNGDFNVFANMFHHISCVVAKLNDPETAAAQIDHAIRECYIQSRPAYIMLPTDMVEKEIEGKRLDTPLDLKYAPNVREQEDFVVQDVLHCLRAAKHPIILVDACSIRHRATDEVHEFVQKSGLPTFVSPMGQSSVDQTLPNFYGVYAGDGSSASVQEIVDAADLILSIGSIKSDFNTSGFTYHTSQLSTIEFHSNYVKVKYSEYHGCRMNGVLRKVTEQMGQLSAVSTSPPQTQVIEEGAESEGQTITHAWFWPNVTNWIRENDVIITETGTSGYGIWNVKFKRGVTAISQILWGSIGYATAACQGAALASKEEGNRRTILFTGDGSFQLTAQELSTMIRRDLHAIIFIICNDGFTIERFIHGMKADYNDIANWNYTELPSAFGARPNSYRTYQAKTRDDVLRLFKDEEFATAACLRLVELHMPWDDAPKALQLTAEASAKNNARQS